MKMHSIKKRFFIVLVYYAIFLIGPSAFASDNGHPAEVTQSGAVAPSNDIQSAPSSAAAESDAFDTNEERAQVHLEEARRLFKAAKFDESIEQLNKSYTILPRPIILFNIGQAYRRMGRRQDAIATFERFIAADPKSNFAGEAQNTVNELRILLKQDEQMQRERKPWRRGWFWGVLGGSLLGAAALTTGLVLGLQPKSTEPVDPRAPVHVQF
jgi:tetratricopeptide (TPR) repeat protein